MRALLIVCLILLVACGGPVGEDGIQSGVLAAFQPLPDSFNSASNPLTDEKVALGRILYHDPRLSLADDVSCATCHPLDRFGVDGLPLSIGHNGQPGARNSPTVFNAAGQVAQFWDGRAATVEEQVEGPLLNPVEMAMPTTDAVETKLRQLPEYRAPFARAFPGDNEPVTYENLALAIGAFERTLVATSRWDDFLKGDQSALTRTEKAGFEVFTSVGCMTCHRGALVGGDMYQRLGAVKSWPDTSDLGRYEVTGHERDRLVFKVPALRDVAETAPYFHDGSVGSLEEAIRLMGEYQLGRNLTPDEVEAIRVWLGSLTADNT
jgi:cytochrome c peroxidase